MFDIPPFPVILAIAVVIFLAIGLHEYAHCKMADVAGDPTPRYYGRVTLDLTKHFEPFGTIMIAITSLTGVGIGWGKPSPMDPRKMRNPVWDHFAAVAAGPISNLLQAVFWAFLLRMALMTRMPFLMNPDSFFASLLIYGVLINLSLFFFNLIPLGPLDGHWLLGTFLPPRTRVQWFRWHQQYGNGLLLILIIVGQLSHIPTLSLLIVPPRDFMFSFLTGMG